jgi:hypothetical protein
LEIDRYSPFERRAKLQKALAVYDTRGQVFERPGGLWGPRAFAPDTTQDKSYPFTFAGGFSLGGQTQDGIRLDTDLLLYGFMSRNGDQGFLRSPHRA